MYSRYYKVCPPFAPSLDKIDGSLTQHDLNSIRNIKTKELEIGSSICLCCFDLLYEKTYPRPRNSNEYFDQILLAWRTIGCNRELIPDLYASMNNRLKLCIGKEGAITRY